MSVSLADIYARNLVGDYIYVYNYSFKNERIAFTYAWRSDALRSAEIFGLLMRDKQGSMRTDTCGLLAVKFPESGGRLTEEENPVIIAGPCA
jgi:hypothetical protein